MWDEGYGAGAAGFDWSATVDGRFLSQHERRELARGWKAGADERAAREADRMQQEAIEATVSRSAWDEIPF